MTEKRRAKDLTEEERATAKAMYVNGEATLGEIGRLLNVNANGLNVALGLHAPRYNGNGHSMSAPSFNSATAIQKPIEPVSVAQLSSDFFNWMAEELIAARAELERTRTLLADCQSIHVSNNLATIYREYTRR